jgi:hypothetical protein
MKGILWTVHHDERCCDLSPERHTSIKPVAKHVGVLGILRNVLLKACWID